MSEQNKVRKPSILRSIKECMSFALENVIRYGDTDIFPYPIERQIFRDIKDKIIQLLEGINADFDEFISQMPVEHEKLLNSVGYTGFRQGTQIDPIWNVYLLGLVLSIGEDIEKKRIPVEKEIVFSYRFKPDNTDYRIFDKKWGWLPFQKKSIDLAKSYKYVLTCDVSDFYPRVYHHRLENALKKATNKSDTIQQIKFLLNGFSKNVSYGLPIPLCQNK
jgi:hypothetical protein